MDTKQKFARNQWLYLFGSTNVYTLNSLWTKWGSETDHKWLRRPETGAVMVQGKMGGSGARFNLGEMTVTRATVQLPGGWTGFGYCAGRDPRKAELIALLDATLQRDPSLAERVLPPLAAALEQARTTQGRKAAATKVDFFTLVRGEDPR
ncbi:MAG: phosphonate C-P lyase system protein PhnG [Alphaproteobacteria bacterium]|nr:phosphonate C-P lyase system protein PhnG [Alphaproteobacteria bacterium]MCB9930101.1 phosphonate C-P lyase system protein PhnG [Alphaproteobacteria bacterium]